MKTLKQIREEYDSQFLDLVENLPEEVMLEASKKSPSLMSTTPSFKQMPSMLLFRRITFRKYPGDQTVALYYSSLVDKYLSIPFGPGGNLNLSEAVIHDELTEDLRKWFKEKWVRYDTKGNIKGPCAREGDEGKPKCRPLASARSMSKEERAKSARRKRREDPVADRPGKGGKPIMVRTEETLMEKNVPTNPGLWARAKAAAKSKFDVYPSAYANGWASKWYKSKGGGWKTAANESIEEACWDNYRQEGMKKKGNRMVPNCVPVKEESDASDETGMAKTQLKAISTKASNLDSKLKTAKNLPAWVQSKIAVAKDGITAVDDYMTHTGDKLDETEAWQRKEGQNPKGGLNRRGILSYRRANPGSKLSMAVTTKPSKLKKGSKAANRRKSFCARMGGMKKRLTSAKTARDPDSRINKALRKWNCEEDFNMRLYELRQQRLNELSASGVADTVTDYVVPYKSAYKEFKKGNYGTAALHAGIDTAALGATALSGGTAAPVAAAGTTAAKIGLKTGIKNVATKALEKVGLKKAAAKSPMSSKADFLKTSTKAGVAKSAGKGLTKRLAKSAIVKSLTGGDSDSSSSSTPSSSTLSNEFGRIRAAKGKTVSLVPTSQGSDPASQSKEASLERKYREKSLKAAQANENKMSDIRKMVKEGVEYKDLTINGRSVTLNTSMAKRILEVYDSVNTKNKKIVEGMLNEDMESFKKLLNFSIKA